MEMKTLCSIYSSSARPQIDWYFQSSESNDLMKIANGSKYVITEEWRGDELTSELSVKQLNSSTDAGEYTCVASENDYIALSPNRTITLQNPEWYASLQNCSSFPARELKTICLHPQPQLLLTSSHVLVLSSTIYTASSSDSASPYHPPQTQMPSIAFQSPSITFGDFYPTPAVSDLYSSPTVTSDFYPSQSFQASFSPNVEQELSLTEWLYVSIVLLLFVLAVIITALLSVIILLIRRNSVRNVVTAGKGLD